MLDGSEAREQCQSLIACFVGCQSTLIGKLAYFSALRDYTSGGYHHCILESVCPRTLVSSLLRASHREAVVRWLSLTPTEQQRDVERFFVFGGFHQFIHLWVKHDLFRRLIPEDIWGDEHARFLCQMYGAIEALQIGKQEQTSVSTQPVEDGISEPLQSAGSN
jgi:hypothetical protein